MTNTLEFLNNQNMIDHNYPYAQKRGPISFPAHGVIQVYKTKTLSISLSSTIEGLHSFAN